MNDFDFKDENILGSRKLEDKDGNKILEIIVNGQLGDIEIYISKSEINDLFHEFIVNGD